MQLLLLPAAAQRQQGPGGFTRARHTPHAPYDFATQHKNISISLAFLLSCNSIIIHTIGHNLISSSRGEFADDKLSGLAKIGQLHRFENRQTRTFQLRRAKTSLVTLHSLLDT
jgi:hypothetical protein